MISIAAWTKHKKSSDFLMKFLWLHILNIALLILLYIILCFFLLASLTNSSIWLNQLYYQNIYNNTVFITTPFLSCSRWSVHLYVYVYIHTLAYIDEPLFQRDWQAQNLKDGLYTPCIKVTDLTRK